MLIEHSTGEPWVVGLWPREQIELFSAGSSRVALLGELPPREALCSIRDSPERPDVEQIAKIPGDFFILTARPRELRACGTRSALRRLWYANYAGVTIAASHPLPLALLSGAGLDVERLALQLAFPILPYPLADQCLWRGVQDVSPDAVLVLTSGEVRLEPRIPLPEPSLSLDEGAARVRSAVEAAITARTSRAGTVSADLSGGMDSTSLAFLAAREMPELVTLRHCEADPASDDSQWASLASSSLAEAQHVVFGHEEWPLIYSSLTGPPVLGDAPFRWVRTLGRYRRVVDVAAGHGSTVHLTGHGGDELFGHAPTHLVDLAQRAPLRALREALTQKALRRWSWTATVQVLTDRRTLGQWLSDEAAHLTEPLPPPTVPPGPWGYPIRMPPWASPNALAAAQRLMKHASEVGPLHPSRALHVTWHAARLCGQAVRHVQTLTSCHGLTFAAPFLDDTVLMAALAVRPEERINAQRYKPLLARAMRGVVPDSLLGRTTKGDFTADIYIGLERNRRDLLELFEDGCLLAAHGLVDAATVRRAILAPHPHLRSLIPLEHTVACELWLRAMTSRS
ncbi:asparagine synthase [Longimycelium tulufanense]|uniref:asparagine synthase n=1 Tax=Longimycelium tulufanense TaxID=907463 RepID=UPI0016649945|nr:asparagine synthase [Longimycelium tulufanense]